MSGQRTFIHPQTRVEHEGDLIDSKGGFDVIECRTCGFKHVIPLPTQEELDKLYRDSFYVNEKPKYFQEAEEDGTWWAAINNNYYALLEKHLQTGGRRLLELGSGPGYFLKCGKERGWDVLGFEPSRQAAEYSRQFGIEVVNESFTGDSEGKLGKFDVVYMNDVLEHVPDPATLLARAGEMLRPDGILCVISPNDYNPLQKIMREQHGFNPWWVSPQQHLNYFDFGSATRLLGRLGFRIIEKTCTFPMEFFLLSGDNYIGNDSLGRLCHARRKAFEENMFRHSPDEYNAFGKFLASRSMGREFVLMAVRT